MKKLFTKRLYFFLAFNISSYGMVPLSWKAMIAEQMKEDIRKDVDEIYESINTVQRNAELGQDQKRCSLENLKARANRLIQSAIPLSVSLETKCRELGSHLDEILSPESK